MKSLELIPTQIEPFKIGNSAKRLHYNVWVDHDGFAAKTI